MTGARGAVIAGGQATRLGGVAKGLLRVQGRRMLDRVADACLEAFGAPPLLVANAPDARSWREDLTVVADDEPGLGALGGIRTALRAANGPVVCVAWDMPFVTAPLLAELARPLDRYDAVVPAGGGPRGLEPLCAGYAPGALPAIDAALARGDLRAAGWLDGVRLLRIRPETLAPLGGAARLFFNVNTPEDLARADAGAV